MRLAGAEELCPVECRQVTPILWCSENSKVGFGLPEAFPVPVRVIRQPHQKNSRFSRCFSISARVRHTGLSSSRANSPS